LDEWESSVKRRKGVTPAQKKMMQISAESLEELQVTYNISAHM